MSVKKIILFLLIFIQVFSKEPKDIIFEDELDLQGLTLQEVGVILEKESGIGIIVSESLRERGIDLHFLPGKNLQEILDTIAISSSLRVSKTGENNYYFYEKIKGRGSLGGKVRIKGYEAGLDGVKVTVLNGGVNSTYTDYGGKYLIDNIVPGSYLVKFEKKGYFREGEFITLKDGESGKNLDLDLKRDKKEGVREPTVEKGMGQGRTFVESGEIVTEKVELININSDEVKKILDSTFSNELIVTSVPKLNTLLLKGGGNSVRIGGEIARDMDSKLKQVRIAAQTLEITDNLFENLGFSWVYQRGSLKEGDINSNGDNIKNYKDPVSGIIGTGLNFIRFFSDKNKFLNFSIDMLKGTSDATVSAIPSILVINGETGRFDIVEETLVSYKTTSTSISGDTQRNTEPIKGEAGIILQVTPIIKKDDTILLKIDVEVSNFLGNLANITSEGGYNPKITRKLSTTVTVDNKDTIFIGGMKSVSSNSTNSKIPVLGDIPYLGRLFQSKSENRKIKDLYIKLKVEIVSSKDAKEEMSYKEFQPDK